MRFIHRPAAELQLVGCRPPLSDPQEIGRFCERVAERGWDGIDATFVARAVPVRLGLSRQFITIAGTEDLAEVPVVTTE
ncbi:MAG TPA: hypothetical protein VIF85_12570 [Gaiellaceae bacterium]